MKPSNTPGNRKQYTVKNLMFNYDKLNDLFYAYREGSSVYSNLMIGEFHLEMNRTGDIVGIEVLHASDILHDYEIPKRMLE